MRSLSISVKNVERVCNKYLTKNNNFFINSTLVQTSLLFFLRKRRITLQEYQYYKKMLNLFKDSNI